MIFRYLIAFLTVVMWVGELTAQQAADDVAPEGQSAHAVAHAGPVEAHDWMISAANPLAVEAGARILREGGTAADAMVGVQAVLGLVEPQSSGLGGGAFLIWYDGSTGQITTLDGRETAPLGVTPRLFQDDSGAPLGFFDAVVGGLSVGTPGTPALLADAHSRWGTAGWAGLFEDAIQLAEGGFTVSPRLAALIAGDAERLSRQAATRDYFLPGGKALLAGQTLSNPAYAETLRQLAAKGASVFYTGPIANNIVTAVKDNPVNPGMLREIDLALYTVKERDPVCARYRIYQICGMGPPSSGALTVGQILGLLEGYDLAALGPHSPEAWRLIGDASRLAFADRGRYMADSDFVPVPVGGLIVEEYLKSRARLLDRKDALPEVAPGKPEYDHALIWADDASIELPSTSHISIVDKYGNALSMTTTIENAFGSRLMVDGFLLNNELTDFSFRTHRDGVPIANRIAPGKRPRSSMAPTIVMQDGRPILVIGSPGGSRIIGYVAKTIIAHLDWDMDVQEAIALPHLINRFGEFDVEAGTDAEALIAPLTSMGFKVNPRALTSGIHAISIGETLSGGADPRREGIALGE